MFGPKAPIFASKQPIDVALRRCCLHEWFFDMNWSIYQGVGWFRTNIGNFLTVIGRFRRLATGPIRNAQTWNLSYPFSSLNCIKSLANTLAHRYSTIKSESKLSFEYSFICYSNSRSRKSIWFLERVLWTIYNPRYCSWGTQKLWSGIHVIHGTYTIIISDSWFMTHKLWVIIIERWFLECYKNRSWRYGG